MIITDEALAKINAARARNGLPPFTKQQAVKLATERRELAISQSNSSIRPASDQSSQFLMHYLIGYSTGIPIPSAGGIIGAAMHESSKPTKVDVQFSPETWTNGGVVTSSPEPSTSPSTSDSSSSYDSSSSSSYDSGSSSSSGGE